MGFLQPGTWTENPRSISTQPRLTKCYKISVRSLWLCSKFICRPHPTFIDLKNVLFLIPTLNHLVFRHTATTDSTKTLRLGVFPATCRSICEFSERHLATKSQGNPEKTPCHSCRLKILQVALEAPSACTACLVFPSREVETSNIQIKFASTFRKRNCLASCEQLAIGTEQPTRNQRRSLELTAYERHANTNGTVCRGIADWVALTRIPACSISQRT